MRRFDARYKARQFIIAGTRLRGGRWTYTRNRYLRHNPACEVCGAPGEEVHHIIPRAQRPDLIYEVTNLQTLCKNCHLKAHNGQKPHF